MPGVRLQFMQQPERAAVRTNRAGVLSARSRAGSLPPSYTMTRDMTLSACGTRVHPAKSAAPRPPGRCPRNPPGGARKPAALRETTPRRNGHFRERGGAVLIFIRHLHKSPLERHS